MIDRFQYDDGTHMPLSNFYPSPIEDFGIAYATVEHYFQAHKAASWDDHCAIAASATPGAAKRAGRRVTLRPDWEALKLQVMRRGLELKFPAQLGLTFDPTPTLTDWLLGTGDQLLVEGNTWGDTTWGRVDGVGHNWLGLLLMARRAELRGT